MSVPHIMSMCWMLLNAPCHCSSLINCWNQTSLHLIRYGLFARQTQVNKQNATSYRPTNHMICCVHMMVHVIIIIDDDHVKHIFIITCGKTRIYLLCVEQHYFLVEEKRIYLLCGKLYSFSLPEKGIYYFWLNSINLNSTVLFLIQQDYL